MLNLQACRPALEVSAWPRKMGRDFPNEIETPSGGPDPNPNPMESHGLGLWLQQLEQQPLLHLPSSHWRVRARCQVSLTCRLGRSNHGATTPQKVPIRRRPT